MAEPTTPVAEPTPTGPVKRPLALARKIRRVERDAALCRLGAAIWRGIAAGTDDRDVQRYARRQERHDNRRAEDLKDEALALRIGAVL